MNRLSFALLIFVVLTPANPSAAQNASGYCNDGSTPRQQCNELVAHELAQLDARFAECYNHDQLFGTTSNSCFNRINTRRSTLHQQLHQCYSENDCILDGTGF